MSIERGSMILEMTSERTCLDHRILVIDDNPDIHRDFNTILGSSADTGMLDDLEKNLFGDEAIPTVCNDIYIIEHAYQGEEGLRKTIESQSQGRPFMVAFVDMRMPPGWDGLETIERMWQVDPEIQVVICTAYSDYSWEKITKRLGTSDKLILLKKPFDVAEIALLTSTLIHRWTSHRQANLRMDELDLIVAERTQELEEANERLRQEIAERKRAEEEIRNKNEELIAAEEEVRKINQHLEQKVEDRTFKIQKLLKQREEFISQLGHDLRSPLTPLVALVPILQERHTDSQSQEILDVITDNVNYMKDLVEKTVQLAAVDAIDVEMDISEVDLSKTLKDILRRKQYQFAENGVNVDNKVKSNIIVNANMLGLTEVFDNLVSNAIKFMPEGGTLSFDAWHDGELVTITVKDTGIGLEEGQAELIFDEFYKADDSRHELGSAGLGLTICKRIIEKYGGRIWARSEGLGKGVVFYFTIPMSVNEGG